MKLEELIMKYGEAKFKEGQHYEHCRWVHQAEESGMCAAVGKAAARSAQLYGEIMEKVREEAYLS